MARSKFFAFSVFIAFSFSSFATGEDLSRYLVYFADKNGTTFSVNEPQKFLSPASVTRRVKYGISLDLTDLPVSNIYLDSISHLGYKVFGVSKWLNAIGVELDSGQTLTALNNVSFVSSTEYLGVGLIGGMRSTCDGGLIGKTLSDIEEYGAAYPQIHVSNGEYLHDLGFDGKDMVLAIIDGGFKGADTMKAFQKIRETGRLLGTQDFVDGDKNVFEASNHGTQVFSCMGGVLDGYYKGTAPGAKYWLIRSEDIYSEQKVEEFNYAMALEFSDSVGVQLINTSLGYIDFDDESTDYNWDEIDGNTAISTIVSDMAAAKGMLLVNSAGNEGDDSWKYISFPADADSVLSIAAVNGDGIKAGFSSFGYPGQETVKPSVAAIGEGSAIISPGDRIGLGNGTSYASPIMAGMVACLWQAFPQLNNMDIIHAVERSASQYYQPDDKLGYGIPDFKNAYAILKFSEITANNGDMDELGYVFPNPFSNELFIYFQPGLEGNVTLSLFNGIGQILYEEQTDPKGKAFYSLNTSRLNDLPKGIYFLQIKNNEQSSVEKLMKW